MSSWLPIPFRVVILGGGLSGLSAAHTLLKHAQVPIEVTLIESQKSFGGWLNSTRFDDGTVFEHGPRSARSYGNVALEALSLLSEIGIDDKFVGVSKNADAASRRYIYYKDEVLELPTGFALMKKWGPLPRSLMGLMMREPLIGHTNGDEDVSVHEFFRKRFQCEEIADYLADPLCHGIFGWDSKQLSLRSCFPILHEYVQQHGSVVRGALFSKSKISPPQSSLSDKAKAQKWMAWSMQGGIQTLPELWSQHLAQEKGLKYLLDTQCSAIKIQHCVGQRTKVHIETNRGTIEADHVVSTLSSPALSTIIAKDNSDEVNSLREMIDKIRYTNMAVVTLQYDGQKIPYNGFGYLVPSKETLDVLGITFDSQIFPHNVRGGDSSSPSSVITVMAGGPRFTELFGDADAKANESKATEMAIKAANDTLKLTGEPFRHVTKIQKHCIPQYHLGHYKVAENIRGHVLQQNMPLSILGTMWGGPGVNDVIVNARNDILSWLTSNHLC